MNHNQLEKQVRDNTALCGLSARWQFPERETLVIGKLGFGTLASNFSATSKPFGHAKPAEIGCWNTAIPNQDLKFSNDKPLSVKNLAKVAEFYSRSVPETKTEVVIATQVTKFDSDNKPVKVAGIISGIRSRLDSHCEKCRKRKGKRVKFETVAISNSDPLDKFGDSLSDEGYAPGVVGLDKTVTFQAPKPSQEEKERQDRNDLVQLGILYMSLFRAIYG